MSGKTQEPSKAERKLLIKAVSQGSYGYLTAFKFVRSCSEGVKGQKNPIAKRNPK